MSFQDYCEVAESDRETQHIEGRMRLGISAGDSSTLPIP